MEIPERTDAIASELPRALHAGEVPTHLQWNWQGLRRWNHLSTTFDTFHERTYPPGLMASRTWNAEPWGNGDVDNNDDDDDAEGVGAQQRRWRQQLGSGGHGGRSGVEKSFAQLNISRSLQTRPSSSRSSTRTAFTSSFARGLGSSVFQADQAVADLPSS